MTKIKDLPKSSFSTKSDLLTIVQNGVTKNITKESLLQSLSASVKNLSSQFSGLSSKINKDVMQKAHAKFESPVMGKDPINSNHLSTKRYVDTSLHNVLKNDGTTQLTGPISYRSSPSSFNSNELVDKNFVTNELKKVLKVITKLKSDEGYPTALAGDSFIAQNDQSVFAIDGPEIQKGDIIICVEDSKGGRHGAVGHQFAIINTNVITATQDSPGILKIATTKETEELISETSALTPNSYRSALEAGSEYNRTIVVTSKYSLLESEKGIVGVDCRKNSVELILPTIGRLSNSKITKYLIKDEYGNSLKNNITLVAQGGDTIEGARTFILNSNASSVKLYCDSEKTWYLESNISSGSDTTSGIKTFVTSDINSGERATTTGAYESVMSIDVDLREYPVGTGFKVVSHCFTAANGNTKTIAIGIGGTQVIPSSGTGTTAPNAQFVHHEVTVLHSNTAKTMAFGFCMMNQDDSSAGLTNSLETNWDSKIKVSVDVLAATAASDVNVYALQIIPLK